MSDARIPTFLAALAAFHLAGCAALGSPGDGMCSAFRSFAESIPAGERRSVTVRTDWGAELMVGCERANKPPEVALCDYLGHNISIEFMAVNIKHALQCAGVSFPAKPDKLYVEAIAGSVRSQDPPFTRRHVEVELNFDSAPGDALPHLTIAMTAEAGRK